VPGDKSISHRYALLAALAEGPSKLTGFAPGADCQSTLACLTGVGVEIADETPGTITLLGRGLRRLRSPTAPLDAGNSGTTMRLMAGMLAGYPFSTTIVGDGSLSRRPMRRVIAPLQEMGASIEAKDGHAPLTIRGTRLHGISHVSETPSAQVKSAVLLAGLHAEGVTRVTEPAVTRDHTERALAAFGGCVEVEPRVVSVIGGQTLNAQSLAVPGDFSSAAFWLVAAAMVPGSRIEVDNVGLNPTRTALLDVLRRFGARVTVSVTGDEAGEPRGTVRVEFEATSSIDIAPSEVPGLIDELPVIAALGACGAEVTIRGAAELRVKESDRIATLVAGFRALGLNADELPDGLIVSGSRGGSERRPRGGEPDAAGDHRMAMAFAVAGLVAEGPSTITGADSVGISYPGFFETLNRLVS